jgi:GNAT superfamily N-acetyltransferase
MKNKAQFSQIHSISNDLIVNEFDCGIYELNNYLKKFAYQNHQAGSSRAYVVTAEENKVVAFYTLSFGSISYSDTPNRVKKGLGKYPVPIILLARLAVEKSQQEKGLGRAIVKDAILRAYKASEIAGLRAILIHSKDAKAETFYEQFGFSSSPIDKFHLYLLMKDIKNIIE